jgi:4,5-DOPA dioxygenase extradiol
MDRRRALATIAVASATGGAACHSLSAPASGGGGGSGAASPSGAGTGKAGRATGRMPAIFLAHGYPLWPTMPERVAELRAWAGALPRPRSVLMISAHWEEAPATIGATETVPLVYDFYGFPEELYRVKYPAPGAPELARRVEALLTAAGQPVHRAPRRGLDHGAYVPMLMMYPEADVPVLQLSLPTLAPAPLLALGRALTPLRDEGVLIVGSGFLTHNLRMFDPGARAAPPAWAHEFDAWAADVLARRDADALVKYRDTAPGVRIALPTHEHFVPVITTLGASLEHPDPVTFPIVGWEGGSLTRRSLQLG